MISFIRCLAFLLLLVFAGNTSPAQQPTEKLKVLVVTGGHGFEEEPFFKVFAENPEITYTAAKHGKESADVYDRENLQSYDVVVMYDMPKVITETQKAKLLGLFEKGTGVVVLHHALCSYQDWPEYEQIIGGRYPIKDGKGGLVTDEVGYQHDIDIPVTIVAKDHPITAGLQDFTIHDEIYWGFRVQPDVTPLLRTTNPKSGNPIAWVKTQGKSRLVFLQLGHGHTAFERPEYRKLVANSIRWVAGR